VKRLLLASLLALVACVAMGQTPTATASLSWVAPTTNTNGSTITAALTYNVYQAAAVSGTCPAVGSAYTAVASGISGVADTLTLPAADFGTTQCFYLVAIETGVDSAASNIVSLAVPAAPLQPNAPTTVVVTVVVSP
jgi:hypothetical protein